MRRAGDGILVDSEIGDEDPVDDVFAVTVRSHHRHPVDFAKRSEVRPSSVAIYDKTLHDRGNVPNMFRTMAHRPEIFETIIAHMDAVLKVMETSMIVGEHVHAFEERCAKAGMQSSLFRWKKIQSKESVGWQIWQ